jgi:hypothetical protein
MSCPYANSLGIPGEGVHATRFIGLALNDLLGTVGLAIVTYLIFKINIVYAFIGWFVLAEILHYLFGVNTAFLRMIGLSPKC